MLLKQPEIETPALFRTQFGAQDVLEVLLDTPHDIGNGILPHDGEDATNDVAFSIPTDVIRFTKTLGESIEHDRSHVGMHRRDRSLCFTAVDEEDMIALSRTLRALGLGLQQIAEGILMTDAVLCDEAISPLAPQFFWREQVEEHFTHFVAPSNCAEIQRMPPPKYPSKHWQLSPEHALSTIPL